MKEIDLILSPLLIPAYPALEGETVYVVADILRASTTIITAFQNGAKRIYPLETVPEAEEKAAKGYLVGAEREVRRLPFARFGNDPFEYTTEAVKGQEIYFTTTNGTRTIKACFSANPDAEVIVGAFSNLSAVADFCREKFVYAVAAGWKGKVSLEDALFGAALYERLKATHRPSSDALRMVTPLYDESNLIEAVKKSDHYPRLVRAEKLESFEYCLTPDTSSVVPVARLFSESKEIVLTV